MADHERPGRLRRWVFLTTALAIGAVCVRLGFWQLDRLEQRRAKNAQVRARMELPPLDLTGDLPAAADLTYRRARVIGQYDPDREIYLSGRSREGITGLHVVTPLRLADSEAAVLVDRGWISDDRFRTAPQDSWAPGDPATLSGLLLPTQQEPSLAFLADRAPGPGDPPLRVWRALSIAGISGQLPYPVLPVYLALDGPPPSVEAPLPSTDLDLSEGPHLGYALQWFAFATTAWVGGFVWFRGRTRRPSS